jgi:hypothetical protein
MNRGACSFWRTVDPPMSLKAKLEAVIYAAEEPVTLAQLAAIFADEVLPGLDESAASGSEPLVAAEQPSLEHAPEAAAPRPKSPPLPPNQSKATKRRLHASGTGGSGRLCSRCSMN